MPSVPRSEFALRPATARIGIQSADEFVGYYIFYTRWRHSTIQVPFCTEIDRRLRSVSTFCISTFFVLVAIFVVFILSSGIALEGWQAGLSVAGLIGITCLPTLIVRPGRYIELLAANDDFIEFNIREPEYARILGSMNVVIPQIQEQEREVEQSEDDNTFLKW